MKKMALAATPIAALFLLLTVGAPIASADTFTFQLTSDHCSGGGGCIAVAGASAGTITINDVSTGVVSVDVTLNSGFKFVSTGFDVDFGFNLLNNPSITFSGVTSGFAAGTSNGSSFTPAPMNTESAGTLHMDGAGDFEYGVVCTACSSGGSMPQTGPLDFTITGTGLSTASFEKNLTEGQYFALDVLGNGNTGAVDASVETPSSVPDGGMTLMLLGGALVGLESLRRRFRA